MSDILLTFDENGKATMLTENCIEIYFDDAAEMDKFHKFVNDGSLTEAFHSWENKK